MPSVVKDLVDESDQIPADGAAKVSRKPGRPFDVHVAWIDGQKQTFNVRAMDVTDALITLYLNDREVRELNIPFANLKYFEVDKG